MKGDFATGFYNLGLCLALVISVVFPKSVNLADNGFPYDEAVGQTTEISKTNSHASLMPNVKLRFDSAMFQKQGTSDLWVDATSGNDNYNGLTPAAAFRSIQTAANIATPGTIVHILPGIYRETVRPTMSGSAGNPIVYRAENGPGTAIIRGSEPSGTLVWNKLNSNTIGLPSTVNPDNLYYADLSAWKLNGSPRRFVVQLSNGGQTVTRLPLAREPDWQVTTEWKYAEFWWTADGGSTVAGCDPSTNPNIDCDASSRSTTQLTDRTSDSAPAGIETGNLTTLGNLTGATLVATDTVSGHYVYRRKIVAHNVTAGTVTVDSPCEFDSGSGKSGLGWGSKYYVENSPALLDTPGEWWYDTNTSRIYLWPPGPGDPATMNIEISRRENGFQLGNRSYITIDGLKMEFFNGGAVDQSTSSGGSGSYNNTVRNATVRYAYIGIDIGQGVDSSPSNITDGFTLENSDVNQIDMRAIRFNYWWPGGTANTFTHAGIVNTVIRNNELHDLGFRSETDDGFGALFNFADTLRFEGNHVHHVAQNGVVFSRSIIQSDKQRGFLPEEIKTGEILIKDNIIEKACLLSADCGALTVWGSAPDNQVFRDVLITGNIFRNTVGWSYVSAKRGRWSGGSGSDVRGMGGIGLYLDHASGIHVYRNIAYNNAFCGFSLYDLWWDGDIVYYNNVAANSLHGIVLGVIPSDARSSINTRIANNIMINNEGFGIMVFQGGSGYGSFLLDHNLYYSNGWRTFANGGLWQPGDMVITGGSYPDRYYQTLEAIQANTSWEAHGVEGNPKFLSYDLLDHALFDGSWPDFHITASSIAINRGFSDLPMSLTGLLDKFSVYDLRLGPAYDIGDYEAPGVRARPSTQAIRPGDTTQFLLDIYPFDFPYALNLAVTGATSDLTTALSSTVLDPGKIVTLAVTDQHPADMPLMPGLWYTLSLAASFAGVSQNTSINLLVGGGRDYLPLITK